MDPKTYESFSRYLIDSSTTKGYSGPHRQLHHKTRHFLVRDGLLFKRNPRIPDRYLRVLRPHELESVLYALHSDPTSGHFGPQATYQRTAKRYYWPQMGETIKKYVKTCDACQRLGRPKSREGLHPIKVGAPFQRIGIDIVGPLPLTKKKNRYIVVATDYLTKWPEARALKGATAIEVAEFIFEDIITRHGCPQVILTDQGTHFRNRLIDSLCHRLGVKHHFSSPYHPQTNGLVERFNRTLWETLFKSLHQHGDDWDNYISASLLAYRTIPQRTTRQEPFFLVYGRDVTLPVELSVPTYPKEPIHENDLPDLILRRTEMIYGKLAEQRYEAHLQIEKSQIKQKQYHDSTKKIKRYSIGDQVLAYRSHLDKQWSGKLEAKWDGPYFIHESLNNGAYKLRTMDGKVLRKFIHGNRLKLFHVRQLEPLIL
jgi:hypothetical protein